MTNLKIKLVNESGNTAVFERKFAYNGNFYKTKVK